MATAENLLSHGAVVSLGWTLIHFVWQATLVADILSDATPRPGVEDLEIPLKRLFEEYAEGGQWDPARLTPLMSVLEAHGYADSLAAAPCITVESGKPAQMAISGDASHLAIDIVPHLRLDKNATMLEIKVEFTKSTPPAANDPDHPTTAPTVSTVSVDTKLMVANDHCVVIPLAGMSDAGDTQQDTPQLYLTAEPTMIPVMPPSRLETTNERAQVQVTAHFLKVSEAVLKSLALDPNLPAQFGEVTATNEGNASLLLDDRQADQILRAAQKDALSCLLSAPQLRMRDGETGTLKIGQQIPYIRGFRDPNDANAKPEPQHDNMDVGLACNVTPTLTYDGDHVSLKAETEIASVTGYQQRVYKSRMSYRVPVIRTVEIATEVMAPLGHTILVRGPQITSLAATEPDEDQNTPAAPLLILIKPEKAPADSSAN